MAKERNDHDLINVKECKEVHPIEVLKRGIGKYFPRIAIASSFSVEDIIVIDMATRIEPAIKVFYINTGLQQRSGSLKYSSGPYLKFCSSMLNAGEYSTRLR